MPDFIPSTRQLLDQLPHRTWDTPATDEDAKGPAAVLAFLDEWQDEVLRKTLAADQFNSSAMWPASPALIAAMRAALLDQRGNEAGERLAFALVRAGCREPATLTALNRWDGLPFRWNAAGLIADSLLQKLQSIGVAGEISPEERSRFNGWLTDPGSAMLVSSPKMPGTLLMQGKVASAALYDKDGCPGYKKLLEAWAAAMTPPLALVNVNQKSVADILAALPADMFISKKDILPPHLKKDPAFMKSETFWKVGFVHKGKTYAFFVPGDFAHVNDGALADEFKLLLRELRRPERVLRLADQRGQDGTLWGNYVVAEPAKAFPLFSSLGIPLQEMRKSVGTPQP
jgi:hypothetical protein